MYLIDANIFLELLLDQSRADECHRFLTEVSEGKRQGFLTDLALDSVLIILESRRKQPQELASFLSAIASYKGLSLYWLSLADRLRATRLMSRHGLDFEDATIVQTASRLGVKAVISFDRDLDTIPNLRRVEPAQIS